MTGSPDIGNDGNLMPIGIHHTRDGGFSSRWISYCDAKGIPYEIVDAYTSDIVSRLAGCRAFMWQHHQSNYKDAIFAAQLLHSLEIAGKKVFPNSSTNWHFDDKIAQKYLFESIGAPFVQSYVFYTEAEAVAWINQADFPKVFKLRGGAGSSNVALARGRREALRFVSRAFDRGFVQYDWIEQFKEALWKRRIGAAGCRDVLRPLYYALKRHPTLFAKYRGNEKGYVYFQDFVPDNAHDIRVIVVNGRAFGIKRLVRDGDFRASGSGRIIHDRSQIDERCVRISFDLSRRIGAQSAAFDFVFDGDNRPLVVEVSYAFLASGYDKCPGYWDESMTWHEGAFDPYGWMVDMMLED